jgi:hypothetical protein
MFLRNGGWVSTDYTALHPRKENSSPQDLLEDGGKRRKPMSSFRPQDFPDAQWHLASRSVTKEYSGPREVCGLLSVHTASYPKKEYCAPNHHRSEILKSNKQHKDLEGSPERLRVTIVRSEKLAAEAGDSSGTQRKESVRRWKPLPSNG